MKLVARKVRFLGTGEEDLRCVPKGADFGDIVQIDGQDAEVIDEAAKQLQPKRSSVIGIPRIGNRSFLNGGYRSVQWGVMPDAESIRRARKLTPEWDFCPKTGDALIPSQKALVSGVKKLKSTPAQEVQS